MLFMGKNTDDSAMVIPVASNLCRDEQPRIRSIAYPPADKRYGGFSGPSPLEQYAQEIRSTDGEK